MTAAKIVKNTLLYPLDLNSISQSSARAQSLLKSFVGQKHSLGAGEREILSGNHSYLPLVAPSHLTHPGLPVSSSGSPRPTFSFILSPLTPSRAFDKLVNAELHRKRVTISTGRKLRRLDKTEFPGLAYGQ